jgi:hypothetical protein
MKKGEVTVSMKKIQGIIKGCFEIYIQINWKI